MKPIRGSLQRIAPSTSGGGRARRGRSRGPPIARGRATGALLSAVALALAALAPASAGAATILSDPVRVTADSNPDVAPEEGFLALPVRLENLDAIPRAVELQFDAGQGRVRKRVALAAGERRLAWLYLPPATRYGALIARVEGTRAEGRENFSWHYGGAAPVLVEGKVAGASLAVKTSSEEERAESTAPAVLLVDRSELPDQLAGYLGFEAVALLETPMEALPETERRALEAWTALGGTLLLCEVPSRGAGALPLLGGAGRPGTGEVPYGFGRIAVNATREACLAALKARRPAPSVARVAKAAAPAAPWDSTGAGPLLAVARAPAGVFLLIVLAFAAVIGPGSFYVRRRLGPALLLAFIPGTALATCLAIATYGVLREGLFTLHASSQAVTLLDGASRRAITAGVTGIYAARAPGRVRFTGLAAVLLRPDVADYALDESEGLAVDGGLVGARLYGELATLSVAPTRARLVLARGEPPQVQNALGARIRRGVLHLRGRDCTFQDVPDGASAALSCEPAGLGAAQLPGELRAGLAPRFDGSRLEGVLEVREGEFLAVLDRAVFAPDGELALSRENDLQVVRGRAEGEP